MDTLLSVIAITVLIYLLFLWSSRNKNVEIATRHPVNSSSDSINTTTSTHNTNKRVRLTNQQIIALSCASFETPIYGENPIHMTSQMPNNGQCFNIRTIDSLVKRGCLTSDGKGGFLLTELGATCLRSGMGF